MTYKTVRKFFPRIRLRAGGIEEALAAGSGAQNNPVTGIWIWNEYPGRTATLCQELYEWRRNIWRCAGIALSPVLGVSLAFAFPAGALPIGIAATVIFGGSIWLYRANSLRVGMESLSHEIEAQLRAGLYGEDISCARGREAASLALYPWTRHLTPEEAVAAMEEQSERATAWIRRNSDFIAKAHTWSM